MSDEETSRQAPRLAFLHNSSLSTESSADRLLCRRPPKGYLEDCEKFVCQQQSDGSETHVRPTVIFRLGREFLAIPTAVVGQVTDLKPVHRIPHQRGQIIKGVTNVHGRLRLFVSMIRMLEIGSDRQIHEEKARRSMIVLEDQGEAWAFAVTEVCGTHNCHLPDMKNVPVTVAKSTANYLRGVFEWQGHDIGLLDDELLFFSLRRGKM